MSEKTEAPTPRRISDARAEGQVARSIELNAAAGLLVSTWLVTGPGKRLLTDFQGLLTHAVSSLPRGEISQSWLTNQLVTSGLPLASETGLIILGVLLTGVAVTLAQTGFLWAPKRIGFDFNRVNPLSGFKRLFSGQGLVELLKASLKLFVVSWVAYSFLRTHQSGLLNLSQMDLLAALGWWSGTASGLALRVGGTYLILALADYAYQRWNYMRSMRMTKEEIKEDLKRSEGDPFLRSRIRSQQRRMIRSRMMANVPKADVIITNPTHLAIAIQYDSKTMRAPRVLAKGAHLVAQRIVALAKTSHIPIVQNIPLAHALYRVVEVDQDIPPELYMAMAEVLAYVYGLRGKEPTPVQA